MEETGTTETTETTETKSDNIFQSKGQWSMRRVLACFFAVASVAGGVMALIFRLAWQSIAASFGVPGLLAVILLFFTTWSDVASVAATLKK